MGVLKPKPAEYICVCDLTSLNSYTLIAKQGYLVDVSSAGFILILSRKNLAHDHLRGHLTLDSIVGHDIVLYLPQMNLDLDGTVTRTTYQGRGTFEVCIEFGPEVPEYWKECLIDLLPSTEIY